MPSRMDPDDACRCPRIRSSASGSGSRVPRCRRTERRARCQVPPRASLSRARRRLTATRPTPQLPGRSPVARTASRRAWQPSSATSSGVEAASLDASASFVDLGFDSLFLTQANSQFRKQFGVRITFRQLFEEAPSIEALAAFIDARLSPEALPDPAPAAAAAAPPTDLEGAPASVGMGSPTDGRAASRLEQLMGEQIRLVQQQLELLRAAGMSAPPAPAAASPATLTPAASAPKTHYLATRDQGNRPAADHHSVSERQRAAIDDLVRRSNARTPGSKQRAQQWRTRLADNRTIVGFDQAWKELVYQVVSVRSAGSRVWDVDGNEYIDTALGFGTNLFGHSPDFVVAAVREQLERGYEVGIQNHLLGEVTEMACAATGNARMAYTTSGGEAVETAIRGRQDRHRT